MPRFNGVPIEQEQTKSGGRFGGVPVDRESPSAKQESQNGAGVLQTAGNIAAGAVRGAGSIGATLLAPIDIASDALAGKGLSLESNRQRRADMDAALQSMGAEPDSMAYQGGKLATEVAGTLPIGGLLGKGAQALGAAPKVVSALNTGGFALNAPKAATVAGRAGDIALRAGAGGLVGGASAGLVDPEQAAIGGAIGGALPVGAQVAGKAGAAIRKAAGTMTTNILGGTTGAGADALRTAFEAGKKGSQEFLDNMRGKIGFEDVVDQARGALGKMKMQRSAAYKAGMADISKDKSVLDFKAVDDALNSVTGAGKYKGVQIRQKASETVDDLKEIVNTWRDLKPDEYHTPEGFDALKQAIGDVRDSTQYGTNSRRVADQLYNSVKTEINKQAPGYAKVMKDYQDASDTLKEIERTLSLGDKGKVSRDTSLRKFQSLMRNNAQTNYGNRLDVAKKLQQGGADVMPAVAGQALSSWTPRGMVGAMEKGGIPLAAFIEPTVLAAAPFTSPRLMGEAAYLLGRGAGGAQLASAPLSNAMLNIGRSNAGNALLRTAPSVILSNQAVRR